MSEPDPKPNPEPTPEQAKMIQTALDDTIEAIRAAAVAKFRDAGIKADVRDPATKQWETRYRPMYIDAVVCKKLVWDNKTRKAVLERAHEVGVIAADLAAMKSVLDALHTGGVGGPGKNVYVRDSQTPYIDADIAEWASLCVDCDEDHGKCDDSSVSTQWDWCTSSLSPAVIAGKVVKAGEKPHIRMLVDILLKKVIHEQIANGQAAAELELVGQSQAK